MTSLPPRNEELLAGQERFDIDKALNTKGFAEFLASHPDAESFDMENAEELKQKFETFNLATEVTKGMQDVFSNQIQKDLEIKLDENEKALISKRVQELAIGNPESVVELKAKITAMVELPKQIEAYEEELRALGGPDIAELEIGILTEDKKTLETAHKNMGILGKPKLLAQTFSWLVRESVNFIPGATDAAYQTVTNIEGMKITERFDAIDTVKEKYGNKSKKEIGAILFDVDTRIGEAKTRVESFKNADNLRQLSRDTFKEMRKGLYADMGDITDLMRSIQKKADAKLSTMIGSDSLAEVEKAQAYFEKAVSVGEENDSEVLSKKPEDSQKQIDNKLESIVKDIVKKKITDQKSGANMLTGIEKGLAPLLEKEKLGTKEGDELRAFLSETLEKAVKELITDEDKAKKVIVRRLIAKINAQ